MGLAARKASEKYAVEHAMQIILAHYERLVFAALSRRHSLNTRIRSLGERLRM